MGMMLNLHWLTKRLYQYSLAGFVLYIASYSTKASDTETIYTTEFSKDIASIEWKKNKTPITPKKKRPNIDINFNYSLSKESVGKFVYKALDAPDKFVEKAATITIFTGLESMGFSKPIKQSIHFIKEKTRFDFGKCGRIRFSGKMRAESCLTDTSSVELQSNYDLNSMILNFKWAL